MEKIRWGIISTANIGKKRVIPAIQASSNGEVLAISSRNQQSALAAAEQMNIPRAYGSYEELLADPDIDAIYNPLPNHLHAEWSIRAAQAGKPTLCEKPFASDAAEAQHMVSTFAALDVPLAEAFMYRFHPQTVRVKQMIDEGAVGNMQIMLASFTFFMQREDDIRLKPEMSGGSLMDVGFYCVNVMRLMTGEEPEHVSGNALIGPTGVDLNFVGTLKFPSGVLGHFDCGFQTAYEHSYEIRGDAGRILVERGFVSAPNEQMVIRYWNSNDEYEEITIPAANHYTLMVEDFAEAILEGRPPRYPAEDGVRTMQVIDALYRSA